MVEKKTKINRTYSDEVEISTDCFKLECANYARNIAFDDANPIYQPTEHCHWFHTVDSSGRKMDKANSVGGHYHDMIVRLNDKGDLVGESGPAKNAKGDLPQQHQHVVTYIRSDKLKKRNMHPEALKSISEFERI